MIRHFARQTSKCSKAQTKTHGEKENMRCWKIYTIFWTVEENSNAIWWCRMVQVKEVRTFKLSKTTKSYGNKSFDLQNCSMIRFLVIGQLKINTILNIQSVFIRQFKSVFIYHIVEAQEMDDNSNKLCKAIISCLFFTSLIPFSTQCSTCINFQYFKCNICYNSCPENQVPQFISCEWTYCSKRKTNSSSSSCLTYSTKSLTQQQCFSRCCDSSQNYFSVEQLNRCDLQNQQKVRIGVIVGSIVGTVFALICICVVCIRLDCPCCHILQASCNCFKDCFACIKNCKCCRKKQQQVPNSVSKQHLELQDAVKYAWMQQPDMNDKLIDEESNCAICLTNRADILSKCGHYYHLDCIQQWFRRNQHCPLCKREDIRHVQFFCRGCCQRYLKFDLKLDGEIKKKVENAKGPNCPICQ